MPVTTNYIDELNESQRKAVMAEDGPSLVIAGAGSGKTRVLTCRIKYLIMEKNVEARNILALTFTNKAAKEIVDRVFKEIGKPWFGDIWMGTFHSVFLRILRSEHRIIGFSNNFTIYDSSDSKSLIKSILKELELDVRIYKPNLVLSRISNAKNHLISPEAYAASGERLKYDLKCKVPRISDIYKMYNIRCKQSDVMDFDDILVYTYVLFNDYPKVCKKYSEKFRYIFVDEYQDTNEVQSKILKLLVKEPYNLCVVGDDAQSIYSFRGATIENILNFTKIYPTAKLFKLEQNYRSTQVIVKAANSLIDKNRAQIKKEVFSENEEGERIQVSCAYSDVEEGEIVVNKIAELHRTEKLSYADFAILYRTNAQSRIFEEALRKRSLPYRIYGGLSFYQRKEIKDVIAYFRLVTNPDDEEAFKRIINYPARGIGDTTVSKIVKAAVASQVSLWSVICEPEVYGLAVNKGTLAKLNAFRMMIMGFKERLFTEDAFVLGQDIIRQSGIISDIYADKSPENLSRQENIEELVNGVHDFCATRQEEGDERVFLMDFLSEVSLLSDQDMDNSDSEEKVTLMTVHSAKGLEFNTVFVVGLEEDLFPGASAKNSFTELEEERRLFYVAITRAEKHCFLSFARSRFRYGHVEFGNPSCFIRDIDSRYLSLPAGMRPDLDSRNNGWSKQMGDARMEPRLFERPKVNIIRPTVPPSLKKVSTISSSKTVQTGISSGGGVCAGQKIEHERFGLGIIESVEGTGENCKATVRFTNAGVKQLLLKYARFKVIE